MAGTLVARIRKNDNWRQDILVGGIDDAGDYWPMIDCSITEKRRMRRSNLLLQISLITNECIILVYLSFKKQISNIK